MKRCFDCGKFLEPVPSSKVLNNYQWDAEKAGDWFAPCEHATHPNGNCYFNDTPGLNTLKSTVLRKAAADDDFDPKQFISRKAF